MECLHNQVLWRQNLERYLVQNLVEIFRRTSRRYRWLVIQEGKLVRRGYVPKAARCAPWHGRRGRGQSPRVGPAGAGRRGFALWAGRKRGSRGAPRLREIACHEAYQHVSIQGTPPHVRDSVGDGTLEDGSGDYDAAKRGGCRRAWPVRS